MNLIHEYSFLNIPNGTIRLSVTNSCNMRCFYCHNEGQNKGNVNMLSFKNFKFILNLSKEFGLRGISISGGEPLLNPDIARMLYYCKKIGLKKIDVCTNGILINKFIDVFSDIKNIDITVGVDRVIPDKISKQSPVGKTFKEINKNIRLLIKNNIKTTIDSVYSGKNRKEIFGVIEYCIENNLELRIIEMDTYKHITTRPITPQFEEFIRLVVKKYKLKKIGYLHPGKGYFGSARNGTKIFFYNAKCHSRDCLNCSRSVFRINSKGEVIPCYVLKNLRIPLLGRTKNEARKNFLKAISLTGYSPDKLKNDNLIHW